MDIFALLENVVLFLMLMLPGYLMGRSKLIADEALPTISNMLTYIAMPFIILQKMLETDLRAIDPVALLLSTLLPILLAFALLFVSKLVFPSTGDPARYPTARFCTFLHNCGFWGIPLAAALFPHKPEVVVYVSMVNIINTIMLLTVGIFVLSGDKRNITVKSILLNPGMIALVLGVILSLLNVGPRFSQLISYSEKLANLAAPLSMLVLGVETSKQPLSMLYRCTDVYRLCLLKLVLSPVLMMGALFLLRLCGVPVSETLIAAMFLATAVSSASSSPAMAARYGLDSRYSAVLTIASTLACVVTMPALYAIVAALI